jgi:hypothetical protein
VSEYHIPDDLRWWLQELEDSDPLSDEALAHRFVTIRGKVHTEPRQASRRIAQKEALEHLMAQRFLANTLPERARGNAPASAAKVLKP